MLQDEFGRNVGDECRAVINEEHSYTYVFPLSRWLCGSVWSVCKLKRVQGVREGGAEVDFD